MADTITCTGDCIKCSTAQRIYCAAQHCYAVMQTQQVILAQLQDLRDTVSQARAVAPIKDETGTESDAGAENRASIKRRTSKKTKENELQQQ